VWARKAIWQGMDKDGFPFMGHFPASIVKRKHDRDMLIELVNGSIFQIVGTDTLDVVGVNPVGCVFSEYSLQNPKAFQYVTPILNENDGWAAFNFTPRGKNHAWKLLNNVKNNPAWYVETLTIKDTGVITQAQVDADIASGVISKELAEQEYHCSFDFGMEGSVFGEYMRTAKREGRIGRFPYDPSRPAFTFWDIGISEDNAMSLWVAQFPDDGNSIHLIDHMEEHNRGIDWFRDRLEEKKYWLGGHFGPHDMAKRDPSNGTSLLATTAKMGMEFQMVTRTPAVEADIELVRVMFKRLCYDDTMCEHGMTAVSDFHRDQETGKLVKDWTNHSVDALRCLCRAVELGMVSGLIKSMRWRSGQAKRQEKTISEYNPFKDEE
jgi:hypothetical protein